MLAAEGHYFAKAVFMASAVLFLVGYVGYPKKAEGKHRMNSFTRRKCCDALLVASSFLAWGGVGNFMPTWSNPLSNVPLEIRIEKVPVLESAMARPFANWHLKKQFASPNKSKAKKGSFFEKIKSWKQAKLKVVKARIRQNIALIRQAAKALEGGTIALLVLASLLIFAALGYLTAAISCNLSCNGQEGAATAVLVLGCAAIAGLIAWMWTAAVRKERRKKRIAAAAQVEAISTPLPLLSEQTVHVRQPNIRIRLVDKNPKDNDILTVRLGEKVLFDKINPGAVYHWANVSLNPDESNTLSVQTLYSEEKSGSQLEIFFEDGTSQQHLQIPIEAGKRTDLHFQIKE